MGEGANIYQERLEDLSIYYWLKRKFPTFVKIEDGYPEDQTLVLPTVAFEWDELTGQEFELGNREVRKERVWYFFIFAKNKSQRDEFTYQLFNDLQDGVPVYNFNEGFPVDETLEPTQTRIGTLSPITRQAKNIPVDPELVDELYYRAVLSFTAEYNQI